MRGRRVLLVCIWLIELSIGAHLPQFRGDKMFKIVGGSSELKPFVDEDKGSPQPTPTTLQSETKTASQQTDTKGPLDDIKARKKRPKLNLGMDSSALEKVKSQSSKLLSTLGPTAVAFVQLFSSSDGKTLVTRPAVYTLALLGSSCGFHLFLYFITIGYCCGVTLPVFVALIVYNVSGC